jgi:nitroreductase
VTLSALEVHNLKAAPPVEGVLPVFHHRWSARSFENREVSTADLVKVFEAARWAPSSNNEQPWRFVVGTRGSATRAKILESLVGFNKTWAGSAPVLILGVAGSKFTHNGAANGYALYDLGAAASYLVLQAAALGLTSHQMAGYDHEALRKSLEIPEDYALGSVIALGYQGAPETLANEQLLQRETAPRERKALSELVFSSWGEPAKLA